MTNRKRTARPAAPVLPQTCEGRGHTTTLSLNARGDYSVRCTCGDSVSSMESWGVEFAQNLAALHRMTGEAMADL